MRKPRNPKYTVKAYYIENDITTVFYCKEKKMRNLTNEMGASMALSNGERLLETDSMIEFKMNETVKIANETLLVQESNGEIDPSDLNSMRGNPKYIQFVLVR
jgi:hypothetical protein